MSNKIVQKPNGCTGTADSLSTISRANSVINFERATWDDTLVNGLDFLENSVLQIPFFFMGMMRHITPTLDNM